MYITEACESLPTVIFWPFGELGEECGRALPSTATSPFRSVMNATPCGGERRGEREEESEDRAQMSLSLDCLRLHRRRRGARRANAPNVDRAVALHVVPAQRIEVEAFPDPAHHGLGDDDLAPEVLGEPFHPAATFTASPIAE